MEKNILEKYKVKTYASLLTINLGLLCLVGCDNKSNNAHYKQPQQYYPNYRQEQVVDSSSLENSSEESEFIVSLKKSYGKQYEYFLNQENDSLLNDFIRLAENPKLLSSKYYDYVLENSTKVNDEIFGLYVDLATNENLLNSEYYEKVMDKTYYIDNIQQMYIWFNLVTNKDFLESKHCGRYIYNFDSRKFANLNFNDETKEIIDLLLAFATNEKTLSKNESIYEDILDESFNIVSTEQKRERELNQFINIITHENLNDDFYSGDYIKCDLQDGTIYIVSRDEIKEIIDNGTLNTVYACRKYTLEDGIRDIISGDTSHRLSKYIDLEMATNKDLDKNNPKDVLDCACKCYGLEVDEEYYECIISSANKMKNKNRLVWFIDMALRYKHLKDREKILEVINKPMSEEKYNIIRVFFKTSSTIYENHDFYYVLSLVDTINDYDYYACFHGLVDELYIYNSVNEKDYKPILTRIVNLGEDYRIPMSVRQFLEKSINPSLQNSTSIEDVYKQLLDLLMNYDNYDDFKKQLDELSVEANGLTLEIGQVQNQKTKNFVLNS